jgi:hypothetical protein
MATPSSEDLADQADFIFNGTVEQAGGSTERTIQPTESTAIVRVDEVVKAPVTFAGLEGQLITVLLRTPGSPQQAERVTFSVNGVMFGDSIVVQEVDHSPTRAVSRIKARIAELGDRRRDSEISTRIASADVIVEARVAQVRAAVEVAEAEPGLPGPLSEHYPEWMEATLDIRSVLKGHQPQDPTLVLFPASIDVMWVKAPKFHAGQEGIWMLHSEHVPRAATRVYPSVYTALDADDFQPGEQGDRIRGMVENLGG